MSAPPLRGDRRAGFTGLLVAAVLLLVIMVTIVHLTNLKFAGEGAHGGAARPAATH